jgi:glutathione synthase/RimK-type ligase-like ATP-grasp enzyme
LKFAENIAKKFNAEISFIDIFTTRKGYFLNEINTSCNLTFHERASKYNISKKIAEYLLKAGIRR